jgi:hypothetical protein
MFLEMISRILTCLRLTLPLFTGGSRFRSGMRVSVSQSALSSASISSEDSTTNSHGINLGELLYPVFNSLVPLMVESIPYVYKVREMEV